MRFFFPKNFKKRGRTLLIRNERNTMEKRIDKLTMVNDNCGFSFFDFIFLRNFCHSFDKLDFFFFYYFFGGMIFFFFGQAGGMNLRIQSAKPKINWCSYLFDGSIRICKPNNY